MAINKNDIINTNIMANKEINTTDFQNRMAKFEQAMEGFKTQDNEHAAMAGSKTPVNHRGIQIKRDPLKSNPSNGVHKNAVPAVTHPRPEYMVRIQLTDANFKKFYPEKFEARERRRREDIAAEAAQNRRVHGMQLRNGKGGTRR